jgi:hypothetical protein
VLLDGGVSVVPDLQAARLSRVGVLRGALC